MHEERSNNQRLIQDLTHMLAIETALRVHYKARTEELERSQEQPRSEQESAIPIYQIKIKEITHANEVSAVSFSSDRRLIGTGSFDSTAKITDVTTGATLRTIKHNGKVMTVDFSPDGLHIATGSMEGTAKITDVATGATLRTIKHDTTVFSVDFSPDGRHLATGAGDNIVKITKVFVV
mmetsp:Transcript_59542/g.50427  ORF Transcript_59542/g.50427 Transcript_59542/m.50427 type:complete len:179 (+) Transcript_59542:228-764(+)